MLFYVIADKKSAFFRKTLLYFIDFEIKELKGIWILGIIKMLNLQKRVKGIDENKDYLGKRISIRDKLLAQGRFFTDYT